MNKMFALVPVNVNTLDHIAELKKIGLLRCKACIPVDAISDKVYLKKIEAKRQQIIDACKGQN